jgi:hypothetical protein
MMMYCDTRNCHDISVVFASISCEDLEYFYLHIIYCLTFPLLISQPDMWVLPVTYFVAVNVSGLVVTARAVESELEGILGGVVVGKNVPTPPPTSI